MLILYIKPTCAANVCKQSYNHGSTAQYSVDLELGRLELPYTSSSKVKLLA